MYQDKDYYRELGALLLEYAEEFTGPQGDMQQDMQRSMQQLIEQDQQQELGHERRQAPTGGHITNQPVLYKEEKEHRSVHTSACAPAVGQVNCNCH